MSKKDSNFDRHEEKVRKAKSIAERKQKVKDTYVSIETSLKRLSEWFSQTVDKILFSRKYDKVISLLLAGILYMTINFSSTGLLALDSTYTIKNHVVTVNSDPGIYEVTGVDKTVDVVLTARSATDVSMAKAQQNTKVVLDLSGLQTGEHTVKYTPTNFHNKVSVTTKPESVTVQIRKKETAKFNISHDYLNQNKMDEKYYPEDPIFETTEVLVRASAQTLDSIAYVKALIDVKDATETFETEANLYAYNVAGEKIEVDIIPKIVKAKVPITSPSKTVEVKVVPQGILPNDKSIDSITLDQASVELFGSQAVLDKTDEIKVNVDVSEITKDTKVYGNIILPSGIRHASVSKVNLDIKLGDKKSKVLKAIPIAFENNTNGYKTKLDKAEQAEVDITVYGTESVLESVTEENFGRVYFDMAGIEPGNVVLPLLVDTKHYLVTYTLSFEEIKMEVVAQ